MVYPLPSGPSAWDQVQVISRDNGSVEVEKCGARFTVSAVNIDSGFYYGLQPDTPENWRDWWATWRFYGGD